MVTTHIGHAWDGAIVRFPSSSDFWMKVCDKDGCGGVVCLRNGLYIPTRKLTDSKLGTYVTICAMNLEDFCTDNDEGIF